MSSVDRLIELARKTGDRLIIHDPYGDRDFVILDIEQYKNLVRGKDSIRQLSHKEMVQKVNRDIAIWRSDKEASEHEELWQLLAQDAQAQGSIPENNWHSLGKVVKKQLATAPKIVAIEQEEAEANPQDDVIYEIPVEEVISPLPSTIPVQSVEWDVPATPVAKQDPLSSARERMNEGLAAYVKPEQRANEQEIPKNDVDLASFEVANEESLPEQDGPVFFEEPV